MFGMDGREERFKKVKIRKWRFYSKCGKLFYLINLNQNKTGIYICIYFKIKIIYKDK
jgi:hypothetical protein